MNPVVRLFAIYWIWSAIACQLLSFAHALDPLGMGIAHLVLVPLVWKEVRRGHWSFKWHRYLRGLPLLFAILVILLAVGSVLSDIPKQADYLEYRLFRMMRWCDFGRIAFIPDARGGRANYSGMAQECAILPSLVLFKTDRIAMLFSWLAFATLPGLTFRLARLLGTRHRIAWILAWALPASYAMCVAQAGGGGNDIYGVWFGLFLCILLLQPWRGFESLPLLAGVAGVFSNAKTSNEILLAVLGLCALAKFWKVRRSLRPVSVVLAALVFLGSSVVPLLAMNQRHYGSISGPPPVRTVPAEEKTGEPTFRDFLVVNAVSTARGLIQPPALLGSSAVGGKLNRALRLQGPLERCYGKTAAQGVGFAALLLLQTEESAGAGLLFLLLLATALAGCRCNGSRADRRIVFAFAGMTACIVVLFLVLTAMHVAFGGVTRIMGVYWYLFGLAFVGTFGASWTPRFSRFAHRIAAVCILGGMAVAAFVPTRMVIPEKAFVRLSGLVSPAMAQRARETAAAYARHGREFRELSSSRTPGPVAFSNLYNYMSAYWRLSDTSRLSTDWTTPILCNTPEELFRHDKIVLTSFDLAHWNLPPVDACAAEHGFTVVSRTTALFKRADGPFDIWFLTRPAPFPPPKEP